MNTSDILKGLNESQKKAVTTTDGPLLVVAGPGTGKTLTIVRRIAYLIHQGVAPGNILAVTFTNRAAREMRERIISLPGNDSCRMFIGTFHVLGLKIMKDTMTDDFIIHGRDEQINLLKGIVRDCKSDGSSRTRISYAKGADRISRVKSGLEEIDDELKEIYKKYQSALAENSAVDFDDLILRPAGILENEGVAERYRRIFKYIIVDEYQDINTSQYRLLRLLAGDKANICAVGDSDQAIYAFRGADIGNFLNFEKDFNNTSRIHLTDNYRSTGTIIDASNNLIRNNVNRIDKGLKTVRDSGSPINIISVPDERAEGNTIVREIEQRMGGTSHYRMLHTSKGRDYSEESYRFSDFAVIFRTNAQAKAIEEALILSGIPYQMVGRRHSLQAKATSDTLAYLRSLIEPSAGCDTGSTGPIERGLLTPADFFDPSADAVTLMTMHMAKGLEFRVVFIAGVEDGLVPFTLIEDGIDIEEERRLFYVGMTRAKDELFLIHSRNRFLYGQRLSPPPSPFLKEIPGEFINGSVVPDRIKKQKEDNQMGLF